MQNVDARDAARALLRWYVDAGVDEAVGATTVDQFAPRPASPAAPKPAIAVITASAQPSADEAVVLARNAAAAAATFDELAAAVAAFDACPLKAGARNTCFADGVSGAPLLVVGEAPGRDEDAVGKPFVGRAGQLLDKMLGAIGRSRRSDVLISNVVFWRPPGNRAPTQAEIAICRPFVERLIELTSPNAILLAGGVPTQTLIGAAGIMRARGAWRVLELPSGARFSCMPIFHPAFLLRQPSQKRLAWADLQTLAAGLREA